MKFYVSLILCFIIFLYNIFYWNNNPPVICFLKLFNILSHITVDYISELNKANLTPHNYYHVQYNTYWYILLNIFFLLGVKKQKYFW